MADEVDNLYDKFSDAADGHNVHDVMVALGALYADIVGSVTTDESHIRDLYHRLANAAVYLAQINDDSDEFQAEEDPTQKAKAKKARSKTGNEPGPSSIN